MKAGLETFAKVRALHDGTSNPGERAVAAGKMKTLARKAGMTVAQAKAKLDAPAPAPRPVAPRNIFEELFNTPEFRAQRAERERERALRRVDALAEYGSEDAIWEPCAREAALVEACRPVIQPVPIIGGDMDTLQGWHLARYDRLPAESRAAIAAAYPPPANVREAWEEFAYWEKRAGDRSAFFPDYDHIVQIRARVALVEHLLDTLPALSLNDLRARLAWMRHMNEREWNRGNPEDRTLLDCLTADVERMGALIRETAP